MAWAAPSRTGTWKTEWSDRCMGRRITTNKEQEFSSYKRNRNKPLLTLSSFALAFKQPTVVRSKVWEPETRAEACRSVEAKANVQPCRRVQAWEGLTVHITCRKAENSASPTCCQQQHSYINNTKTYAKLCNIVMIHNRTQIQRIQYILLFLSNAGNSDINGITGMSRILTWDTMPNVFAAEVLTTSSSEDSMAWRLDNKRAFTGALTLIPAWATTPSRATRVASLTAPSAAWPHREHIRMCNPVFLLLDFSLPEAITLSQTEPEFWKSYDKARNEIKRLSSLND